MSLKGLILFSPRSLSLRELKFHFFSVRSTFQDFVSCLKDQIQRQCAIHFPHLPFSIHCQAEEEWLVQGGSLSEEASSFSFVILCRVEEEIHWIEYFSKRLRKPALCVLSRKNSLDQALKGLRLGVTEYLPASLAWKEVTERVGVFLKNLFQKQMSEAYVDQLTGLYNMRFLYDFLKDPLLLCGSRLLTARERSWGLLFLDIDYFKQVNEAYGHLVGSQVLRELGHLLNTQFGEPYFLCRYGGDEFVVILPQVSRRQAHHLAERLREKVASYAFQTVSLESVKLTVSIGVAVFSEETPSLTWALEAADRALYSAKRKDRNCVVLAG